MEDYYSVLGLKKGATPEEIKRSYRKLASQHHPDKGGDTAQFQKIEEAYRILSDPVSRGKYDNSGAGFQDFSDMFDGIHININQHPHFRDFFSQIFGQAQPRSQEQRRNRDLRINVDIPLNELFQKQKKVLRYTTSKNDTSVVEIDIPIGVENGATIRYPNLGDNFFDTLPRGDLYVTIRHIDSDKFRQVGGADVLMEHEIECWDAMLGTTVKIIGLDGVEFNVRIPAGTQPGARFNLKGQGLYVDSKLQNRGNLFLMLHVRVPQISEQHRARIEEIRKTLNTDRG